jgi:phage protein D
MNAPLQPSTRPCVDLDGQPADALVRDLIALEIRADVHGMKRLRLELAAIGPRAGEVNESQHWLDGRQLKLGSELSISLGPPEVAPIAFAGKVSQLGGLFAQGQLPRAQCFAEDGLWDLRQTRRIKTWEQLDLAGIAQQIASEHGLSAQVDAASPTWALMQQWNETDLAFLRARCAAIGAELWFADGQLRIATREARQGNELTLVQGNELIALDIDCDLAQQRSGVHISGFDANAKDQLDEAAGSAELGGLGGSGSGGTSGLDALQQAFGERKTQRLHDAPLDAEQARLRAKAELRRRAQGFVRARGITRGSPEMDIGSRLTLQRVGSLFEGDGYVVTELLQRFDAQHGLRTEFVAERGFIASS